MALPKIETIKSRIKASEKAKRFHKANWLLNVMFYKGHQWLTYDSLHGEFLPIRPNKKDWRSRKTVNMFQPIAQVMAAKLTQNRPTMYLDPGNGDYRSRAKARVGRKILEWTWENLDLQRKTNEAVLWSVITGLGWWALYYDDNAGELVVDTATGKKVRSGAPRVDVVKPMDIGLDPMAESLDAVEWAYRVRYVSTEWVKKFLDKNVKGDTDTTPEDYVDSDTKGAMAIQDTDIKNDLDRDYVTLYEFYDLVENKVMWCTKDAVLLQKDWNIGLPFIPFIMNRNLGDFYSGTLTSGQVWGDTIMNQIRELQIDLNTTTSQIHDMKNLTSMPRLLASSAAKIQGNTYKNEPGSVVQWSGNGPVPQQLAIGQVPSYVTQMPQQIIAQMYDISGVHEISQGANPGSIQSARGLMFLAEMDATKFGPMARNISASLQIGMMRVLEIWHTFGQYDVLQQIVGSGDQLDFDIWRIDDLTSFPVRVVEGSTLATSKALRRQDLMQAWNMGVIKDEREMRRLLEFDTTDKIEGDYDDDRYEQKRENALLVRGQAVEVHPWDNDFSHMDELEKILKSPDFGQMDAQTQQVLTAHWEAHHSRVVAIQTGQQQAAMQRGTAFAGAPQSETVTPPQGAGVSLNLGVTPATEANAGMTSNTVSQ